MKPVLICGGVGKKMWPLSRVEKPKHFLPLINGKSLYQINYLTLRKKFRPDQIYIQTTHDQADLALKQAPEIPQSNYFIEPELRDTGPAMGFMAAKLFKISPDEPFTLVQTDVLREPGGAYLRMIDLCDKLVKEKGKLVTGGIRPEHLMMGVDYLQTEKTGSQTEGMKYFKIKKYVDRDIGRKKIEQLFEKKLILIHANHNSWTPRLFLQMYQKYAPDWYTPLNKIIKAFGTPDEKKFVALEYAKMKPDRVERVTKLAFTEGFLIEVPFKWIDFGTWESVSVYQEQTRTYNPGENFLEIDSKNCYVNKSPKKFAALIGVNDLIVIDTDDGLLICKKDCSDRVNEIVAHLKEKGKTEYL